MPIYLNNKNTERVFVGNTELSRVYLGNTLVFQKGSETPDPPPEEIKMDNAYGFLYNWYVIGQATAPTPRYMTASGWVIPSITDYINLKNYVANTYPLVEVGKQLKSPRLVPASHPRWNYSAGHVPEGLTQFGGVPGGFRVHHNGLFGFLGERSRLWVSNSLSTTESRIVELLHNSNEFLTVTINGFPIIFNKGTGCSVIAMSTLSLEDASSIPDYTVLQNWYTGNDGKTYNCIKIFDKVYTENLRETQYRDGSTIIYAASELEWSDGSSVRIPMRCAYNNDQTLALGDTIE